MLSFIVDEKDQSDFGSCCHGNTGRESWLIIIVVFLEWHMFPSCCCFFFTLMSFLIIVFISSGSGLVPLVFPLPCVCPQCLLCMSVLLSCPVSHSSLAVWELLVPECFLVFSGHRVSQFLVMPRFCIPQVSDGVLNSKVGLVSELKGIRMCWCVPEGQS